MKNIHNENIKEICWKSKSDENIHAKNKNQGSVSAYCIAADTEQMRNKDWEINKKIINGHHFQMFYQSLSINQSINIIIL